MGVAFRVVQGVGFCGGAFDVTAVPHQTGLVKVTTRSWWTRLCV